MVDLCTTCKGKGRITCPSCHGAGTFSPMAGVEAMMQPCADCSASGKQRCPVCHGSGKQAGEKP